MSDTDVTIIATIPKNAKERFRIALDRFHELDLIDIRVIAYASDPEGDSILTRKGLSLRIAKLPELIEALQMAAAETKRRGLLNG